MSNRTVVEVKWQGSRSSFFVFRGNTESCKGESSWAGGVDNVAVVVQGERGSEVGVSVTWGLFRAGSGAWATKICALRRSSVPVFFLSSPSHATRFIQPMVLSSRSFVCFGDILTHSLMPRDMAFLAFVSFTGDVED